MFALHMMDRMRRMRGLMLDAAGFGPEETPFRVIAARPGFRLRAYGGPADGPALLIVPAPIKRPYIWDIAPGSSAVRRCLDAGLRVHLIEWTEPDEGAPDTGLADYADRHIAAAVDAVQAGGGAKRVLLAGHSLGGTLAAVFAAAHPQRVAALLLLEAPLAFGPNAGDLAALVAKAPPAGTLLDGAASVPGSLLNNASVRAAPDAFSGEVWRDRLASLGDPQDTRLHTRVIRWTLDEFAMPARLFEDVVERLYREDRFAKGTLPLGSRTVGSAAIACPVLAVVDPRSTVIPAAATLSALSAVPEVRVLHYTGDRGVALQHVGVLVGRSAHEGLWPQITEWLSAHGTK
ncbi:alpha/beta fold hydrolase [Azospirillum sp.]|uniref:alpha/beta fold hydrolase n=1 Tax=Azospirillum sp. TaxID=34012 RepID=UPI002D725414|nr:alpha/beta fold hydrolase [Azospirillum sp.]HYD70890.1 alpha/beta fold hydrolase [Azospirillum sp.]